MATARVSERLRVAMNAHDIDAFIACFAPDYHSVTARARAPTWAHAATAASCSGVQPRRGPHDRAGQASGRPDRRFSPGGHRGVPHLRCLTANSHKRG
jgi:hypothetical protein